MNILYEEDGTFKVGSIMADNTTSLQVESLSGKRSKVKAANVMLRFTQPPLAEFLAQAEAAAAAIEVVPRVRMSWGSRFDIYVRNNILVTQRLLERARRCPATPDRPS